METTTLPYHLQRYVLNQRNLPLEYTSVLAEMILVLVAPLEALGYSLPARMWPDISIGRMMPLYLRVGQEVITIPYKTYLHEFDDNRPSVHAKAYPETLIPEMRRYIRGVWLPDIAPSYFAARDPSALPFIEKLIVQHRKAA